jgi:hypothetical protein
MAGRLEYYSRECAPRGHRRASDGEAIDGSLRRAGEEVGAKSHVNLESRGPR